MLQDLERKHPTELRSAQTRSSDYGQHGLPNLLEFAKVTMIYGWLCYVTQCLRPYSVLLPSDV